MSESTSINLRIDKELKKQAEQLFATLGINMTTAMNIFLRQAVREQALPFKVSAAPKYDAAIIYTPYDSEGIDYKEYLVEKLRESDRRAAEGKMKYFSENELRSKLEEILND